MHFYGGLNDVVKLSHLEGKVVGSVVAFLNLEFEFECSLKKDIFIDLQKVTKTFDVQQILL